MFRHGTARFFEPQDRLISARLRQMHAPNPRIIFADEGIAGTEADGLFYERDYLLYRSSKELALPKMEVRGDPVAIKRDHRLICGNGFLEAAPRAQHIAFGLMRKRTARRCRQRLP